MTAWRVAKAWTVSLTTTWTALILRVRMGSARLAVECSRLAKGVLLANMEEASQDGSTAGYSNNQPSSQTAPQLVRTHVVLVVCANLIADRHAIAHLVWTLHRLHTSRKTDE